MFEKNIFHINVKEIGGFTYVHVHGQKGQHRAEMVRD